MPKKVLIKNGLYQFKPMTYSTKEEELDLRHWLYNQLKEFSVPVYDVCCGDESPPTDIDEFIWDTQCLFRSNTELESTILGSTYKSETYFPYPIYQVSIAGIGTYTLVNGVTSAAELAQELNASILTPANYIFKEDNGKLILYAPQGVNVGQLTCQAFKEYTFLVEMQVYKPGGTYESYSDNLMPLMDVFADITNIIYKHDVDQASNNIHYYHGIYGTMNTRDINLFNNNSRKDMFRNTYQNSSVGVNGYTNRGINEINSIAPANANSWEWWKRNLIDHISESTKDQQIPCVVGIHDSPYITTTFVDSYQGYLHVRVPSNISLEKICFHNLSNTGSGAGSDTNEWNFANNGWAIPRAIAGWKKSDINYLSVSHNRPGVLTPVLGTATITPSINGVGGSVNSLSNCSEQPLNSTTGF